MSQHSLKLKKENINYYHKTTGSSSLFEGANASPLNNTKGLSFKNSSMAVLNRAAPPTGSLSLGSML